MGTPFPVKDTLFLQSVCSLPNSFSQMVVSQPINEARSKCPHPSAQSPKST